MIDLQWLGADDGAKTEPLLHHACRHAEPRTYFLRAPALVLRLHGDFLSLASGTNVSTPDTGSAAAVSLTAFITLLLKAVFTRNGVDGEEAISRPADGAGQHPQDRNAVEDAPTARCGAAGLNGSDASIRHEM